MPITISISEGAGQSHRKRELGQYTAQEDQVTSGHLISPKLNGPARGIYYFAYVIIDLYSRKIVGWEIYESESSEQIKRVVKRAMARENMTPKVIHSDNGSPMKGWSLVEYLYELDVNISRSRPFGV